MKLTNKTLFMHKNVIYKWDELISRQVKHFIFIYTWIKGPVNTMSISFKTTKQKINAVEAQVQSQPQSASVYTFSCFIVDT